MALITDYATLQAQVASYLKRTDLTEQIKAFIQLAEARIFSEPDFNLQTLEKRVTADTVIDQRYYGVPTDAKSIRHIKLTLPSVGDGGNTRKQPLIYMSPERMDREFPDELSPDRLQEPIAWSITGNEFSIVPVPNAVTEMEIFYHAKWTALSDIATTNWLILNQPDIYLYGALIESVTYLVADPRLAMWGEMYSAARDRIKETDRKIRVPEGGAEMFTEISEVMLDYSRRGYLY